MDETTLLLPQPTAPNPLKSNSLSENRSLPFALLQITVTRPGCIQHCRSMPLDAQMKMDSNEKPGVTKGLSSFFVPVREDIAETVQVVIEALRLWIRQQQ